MEKPAGCVVHLGKHVRVLKFYRVEELWFLRGGLH